MQYFILPFILIAYFEVLGQSVYELIGVRKDIFNFLFGYVIVIFICYITTSLLTALDCSFYLIEIIYLTFFVSSLVLVYKQGRKLRITFRLSHFLLLLIPFSILICFSLNTTLGDLNGFDSTHYMNMVTGNVKLNALNRNSVYFGTDFKDISNQYTFQSFYYFASVILYITKVIFNIAGIEFFISHGYIWCFQLIFYLSLFALIINTLSKYFSKKFFIHIVYIFLFTFTYGKVYFASVYGFYGNTIRTIFVAFAIFHLIEYFDNKNKKEKSIFAISMLAACGTSSSAVFMIFFIYFAFFFFEIDNNDVLFKEYAIILFVPLLNLLAVVLNGVAYSVIISIFVTLFLYCGNDILVFIIRKYKLKYPLLILSFLLMLVLSYSVTHDIFDFTAFLKNGSEYYDMTFDYFDYNIGNNSTNIYKIVSLSSLVLYLFTNHKSTYARIIYILILVFFNPFCCSFLNEINVVYYRAYELILNPFTVIMFTSLIFAKLNYRILYNFYCIFIVSMLFLFGDIIHPSYWHESFIPPKDYNRIYKMTNEELNIIREVNALSIYEGIDEPKIITPNLLTQSMIPSGTYIYGRVYKINNHWNVSEKALYDIFWPVIHFGDARQPENPDYDNMCKYINDADIDFIVQPKATEYYDEEQDIWYSLTYKIDECGTYAFYDTDNYSVYRFER